MKSNKKAISMGIRALVVILVFVVTLVAVSIYFFTGFGGGVDAVKGFIAGGSEKVSEEEAQTGIQAISAGGECKGGEITYWRNERCAGFRDVGQLGVLGERCGVESCRDVGCYKRATWGNFYICNETREKCEEDSDCEGSSNKCNKYLKNSYYERCVGSETYVISWSEREGASNNLNTCSDATKLGPEVCNCLRQCHWVSY